ncbi:tRNA (cytosine(34)-C(5))-methyltransferase, mitochondrial isoform 1-T1 [Pholidichthys leucotaenia]
MFKTQWLLSEWWRVRFKAKTVKPTLWTFWCSNFHTGPDVLQQINRRGKPNKVTKASGKQRSSCQTVLRHFDHQYSVELGNLWPSARSVLLDPYSWQYGVMLNRFTEVADVRQVLQAQGFSALLPQTDVSALLSNNHPLPSDSKYQEGNDTLMLSLGPPQQSHLGTCFWAQDPQSEFSSSLSHPSLQCYIHPYPLRFPSQAHRPGQLKQYYLLNAASLLPVLALEVRDGEKVLDLCSAPGGKALAILQSAAPALLCCNEPDPHRREWLAKTLESFLPHSLSSRVIVSAQDGRIFGRSEAGSYDKVLVDAPCSNDRSWLYSCSDQQGEQRLKERASLPSLQAQLLRSALSAVRPGGTVVYSTCTLSSAENFAVVETVLGDFPEAEPEDLWEDIDIPLSKYFVFSSYPGRGQTPHEQSLQLQEDGLPSYQHRLGILVVPQASKTWGPMFLSRIKRRK